jgi:hypothetical protein
LECAAVCGKGKGKGKERIGPPDKKTKRVGIESIHKSGKTGY